MSVLEQVKEQESYALIKEALSFFIKLAMLSNMSV
jgi:hypothetical protein